MNKEVIPLTDDHCIMAGLLVLLAVPTHLVGKPIAWVLELSAPLASWHTHHELSLCQGINLGTKNKQDQGTYFYQDLVTLMHFRYRHPRSLVQSVLSLVSPPHLGNDTTGVKMLLV